MIEKIQYKDSMVSWKGIPEWGKWYFHAGRTVGATPIEESRLVFGISAPIRRFASLFLALGIIYERTDVPVEDHDKQDYFDFLKGLPITTPVSFLYEEKKKEKRRQEGVLKVRAGIICDSGIIGADAPIAVQYVDSEERKTKCTCFFNVSNSHRLVVNESEEVDISSLRRKGSAVVKNMKFLSGMVPPEKMAELAIKSRLECLVVTSLKRFRSELDYEFALKAKGGKKDIGNLLDLVRPRRINSFSQSYRAILHSSNSKKNPSEELGKPLCVLFDSATGYLKWHGRFKSSHQVVLLDRTESLCE